MHSSKNTRKIYVITATVALAMVAVVIFMFSLRGNYLLIENNEQKVLFKEKIENMSNFSVSFTHSVNKTEVEEFYEIRDKKIFLVKCRYLGFGAGVATEVSPGEKLSYEDGYMVISNMDREIKPLAYFVGTVSNHILHINGKSISLKGVAPERERIVFKVN